jgi:DNA-directed RNA polymerase II subunit RPB1
MKAMEGIVVSYDGTVRNSNRQLTQLRYGEDGMDGAFMEFQQLPGIKPSHASFKRRFYFDCSDQRMLTRCFKEDVAWKVMKSTEDHEVLQQEWTKLQEDREALRSIFPTGNTKVS